MNRIKQFVNAYVRFVQNIVVSVALFLLYAVGFGLTRIFLPLVSEGGGKGARKPQSLWQDAEGYADDLEESARAS